MTLHNIEQDLLDKLEGHDPDADETAARLLAAIVHRPLATTPEAMTVSQLPANHIYVASYDIGTTPMQIAFANANRLRLIIQKGTATQLSIGETQASLAAGAINGGFTVPSGFLDMAYAGDLWAVASAAGLTVTTLELLRTGQ